LLHLKLQSITMKSKLMKLVVLAGLLMVMILNPTESMSQSKKYPIVRSEGKDTVVVMTVRQADAINNRYLKMKIQIDDLHLQIDSLQKQLNLAKQEKCAELDSLKNVYEEMAEGPSLVYRYKNSIYSLDFSLYKIKLNSIGRVKLKKMSRWEIGRYFELMHGEYRNLIDWKATFREYDLPLIEDNKLLFPSE